MTTYSMPDLTVEQVRGLEKSIGNASRWFFFISGISLLNVLGLFLNFSSALLAGFGANFYISGFSETFLPRLGIASELVPVIVFAVNLTLIGVFTYIGWLAYRRHLWAYNLGMLLYALDTLIYVRIWAWSGIILHLVGLFFLFGGRVSLIALRNLEKAGTLPLERDEVAEIGATAPIPSETLLAIVNANSNPKPNAAQPFDWKMVTVTVLACVVPLLLLGFILWLILPK